MQHRLHMAGIDAPVPRIPITLVRAMDDSPEVTRVLAETVRRTRERIELQYLATGADVLVIPILVSKGSVSRDNVPTDTRGTPSWYGPEPLLPHPAMARWIEARVAAARGSTGDALT